VLSHGLLDRGLPLLVVAGFAGAASLAVMYRRGYRVARVFAITAVGAVVAGWGSGNIRGCSSTN